MSCRCVTFGKIWCSPSSITCSAFRLPRACSIKIGDLLRCDAALFRGSDLGGIESTHTIDIDSFVPRSEIDQLFFDTPYYITPNEPVGQEAFAVIREAMRSKALVALGRIVLPKRERVMALEPYGRSPGFDAGAACHRADIEGLTADRPHRDRSRRRGGTARSPAAGAVGRGAAGRGAAAQGSAGPFVWASR
jgi:hypothetical protein